MKNQRLIIIQSFVGILLLIPLIAMQFTVEVNWDIKDFTLMGVLLSGTGFLIEFALRKIKPFHFRILLFGVVLLLAFLIWAELAVGLFGTPFAGS